MADNNADGKPRLTLKPKEASTEAGPQEVKKAASRGNSWGTPASAPAAPKPAQQPAGQNEQPATQTPPPAQNVPSSAPPPAPKLRVKRREVADSNTYNPVVERFPEKPPVDYSSGMKKVGKIVTGLVALLIVALIGLAFFPLGEPTDSASWQKALDHIDELSATLASGEIADLKTMRDLQEVSRNIKESSDTKEALAAIRAVYAMGQIDAGRVNQGKPAAEYVAKNYAETQFGDLCNLSGVMQGLQRDPEKARARYRQILEEAPVAIKTVYVRQSARQRLIDLQQKLRFWQ